MYCSRCGCEIKAGGRFCPQCGNAAGGFPQTSVDKKRNPKSASGKRKGKKWITIIVSVCLLVTAVGGVFLYQKVFSEKYLALVINDEGKVGYINENGKEVIECQYDMGRRFSENGIAVVGERIDVDDEGNPIYRYGCINQKGKAITECQYVDMGDFSDKSGLAYVVKISVEDEESIWKYGYINEQGEEVIPLQYNGAGSFSEKGLALVWKVVREDADSIWKYGYINEQGEEVIPLRYDYAEHFSESGLACVGKIVGEDADGYSIKKYGYINEQGEEVIPLQYDYAYSFSESGLACVEKMVREDEESIWKYGYINEQGEEVIPLQYDKAESFSKNSLAVIGKVEGKDEDGYPRYKYGYINKQGEEVIPMQYDGATSFLENGLALVEKENGEGIYEKEIINENGEKIMGSLSTDTYMNTFTGGNGFFYITEWVDDAKYKIFDKTVLTISGKFDYVDYNYGDNGTIAVGKKIGMLSDGQNKYECRYINEYGKTVMKVPDKYIYAGAFAKVK